MSLVGPRPLQLRDYELLTKTGEDWQRCRFSVRPGITVLWQVNGRSSLPFINGWNSTSSMFITGRCGLIFRFWPGRFRLFFAVPAPTSSALSFAVSTIPVTGSSVNTSSISWPPK